MLINFWQFICKLKKYFYHNVGAAWAGALSVLVMSLWVVRIGWWRMHFDVAKLSMTSLQALWRHMVHCEDDLTEDGESYVIKKTRKHFSLSKLFQLENRW